MEGLDTLASTTATKLMGRAGLCALELHNEGWSQARIAEAIGMTRGAVSQWIARARQGGAEALRTALR